MCVGDLLLMHNQEAFPADVLLLASSHPEGRYAVHASRSVPACARARVCVCVRVSVMCDGCAVRVCAWVCSRSSELPHDGQAETGGGGREAGGLGC